MRTDVARHSSCAEPVRSKDEMVFHVGFRRFRAQPLYSQHSANADKHKYERFLQEGAQRSFVLTLQVDVVRYECVCKHCV